MRRERPCSRLARAMQRWLRVHGPERPAWSPKPGERNPMQLSLRTARCLLPAAFFAACTLLAPRVGLAQTVCQELPDDEYPNKIYGVGGSAASPLISSIAREFAKLPGDQRVTIIWHDPGAGHAMHSLIGQEVDGVR